MSDPQLQEIYKVLTEVRVDVKGLKVHVEGNGGQGLLEWRKTMQEWMDTVKDWIATRPKKCPATADEVLKRFVRIISIATAVIGLVTALAVLGSGLMRRTSLDQVKKELKALQDDLKTVENDLDKPKE